MVDSVVVQSGSLPGGGGRHGRRPLPRGAYEFLREGWYWVIKSLVFVVVRCARNTVGEIIALPAHMRVREFWPSTSGEPSNRNSNGIRLCQVLS